MQPRYHIPVLSLALFLSMLVLAGCGLDGLGLNWAKDALSSAGDNTSGATDGGGGSSGGGSSGGSSDTRFSGTWIAAYGDDVATSETDFGKNEYAVRLVLTQNRTSITGSGTMFRVFREGAVAADEITLSVTGTASDDDARIYLSSNDFDYTPVWYLRLADDYMVGVYYALDANDAVARSGCGIWHEVDSSDIESAWVAGFTDSYPGSGTDKYDRTATLVLAAASDSTLDGSGTLIHQQEGAVPLELDFNVTQGAVDGSQAAFSFGGVDLATTPMDWYAFLNEDVMVGAYAQFDATDTLEENGYATWYASSTPTPESFEHIWVTSFCDATPSRTADYLIVADLDVNGNNVSGSAQVLDESAAAPAFATYTVQNGTVVGSLLEMDLVGSSSTFSWALRLGGSTLTGSYQQTSTTGDFISRGSADWRYGSTSSLEGTWAASYYDTVFTADAPSSQLALVTVSNVTVNGTITGLGALRLAGESSRRVFSMSGTQAQNQIIWTWSGTDLFGDTVWHLRKVGDFLYGTYTNYDSAGDVEFSGHALYLRTDETSSYSE
ncbi:MAG: hypothetical protein JXR94_15400 [Candidatus Hydrogenedentes bacterium]|nr:hypothetical protein [Candidatus Hydrogenedentota bacterium]